MSVIQDLIRQGYEIKGPLEVDTEKLTKMGITTESINDSKREDKTVVVSSDGKSKRVSSMMFGYNKKGLKLKDGSFANSDELLAAMEEAVRRQDKGVIVVSSKGEILDAEQMEELIDLAAETAGKVTIGEQNPNITNQEAPNWSVEGPDGKQHKKGAVFLGNGQIKLPSGEYVSVDELNKALTDYLVMVPKKKEEPLPQNPPTPPKPIPTVPEPTPTEPTPEDKQELLRVTKKYKNRASWWLIALSGILTTLMAISIIVKPIEVIEKFEEHAIVYESEEDLLSEEKLQELIDQTVEDVKMGEKVFVEDGKTFGSTSQDGYGVTKTMGEEFTLEGKEEGDYQISGFAIYSDGKLIEYIEDFDGKLTAPSIGDYIDEICAKHNLSEDKIVVKVHAGINNGTRLGWIDITQLIDVDDISPELIEQVKEEAQTFTDRIENFGGNTITLDNGDVINVYDTNGNLLTPGSEVISQNGNKYIINKLDLEPVEKSVTNIVGEKKVLDFDLTAPELAIGLSPLIAALGLALATRHKNKKAQENPAFVSVANNEEKEKFIRDFQAAKEKYEKESGFAVLVKRVFYRKEYDRMQELTPEQVEEVYEAIERHSGRDFILTDRDKVTFKNGKIIIEYHDGHWIDITDIVMEDVHSIGSDNEYQEEGLYDDGIRRKY